jgi:uncharacterized RDD family membrane protein YckC
VQPGDAGDDLVIPTPERVAFQYPIAGIGSRFLAQAVDLLVFAGLFLMVGIGGAAFGAIFHNARLAVLLWLLFSFALVFGYFLISEALWNGQTLGKRALRLRVVGDRGEPIEFSQSAIRNLVRIVDFLPFFYGVGLLALFINGRGKRLGDLAAGTLVVRERGRISLYDLAATGTAPSPPVDTMPSTPSIWAPASGSSPAQPAHPTAPSDADRLRQLEPALRRLVTAYAARRSGLPVARREALARSAEPALSRALPEVVAGAGPLRALDQLAEWEGVTPPRTTERWASRALRLGIASLACAVVVILSPLGVIAGILAILFANRAVRLVREHPDRLVGAETARTGRVLGIIGLAISSLFVGLFLAGLAFSAR